MSETEPMKRITELEAEIAELKEELQICYEQLGSIWDNQLETEGLIYQQGMEDGYKQALRDDLNDR